MLLKITFIHSRQYRQPDPFRNQTVLVGAAVCIIFYLLISFFVDSR